MTNRKALIALRDAVVDCWFPADVSARDLGLAVIVDETGLPIIRKMYDAFAGSVDAAIALLEAVLPENDHAIELTYRPFGVRPHLYRVTLTTDHTGWGNGKYYKGESETAARALLIATLNALIAKEQE